MRKDIQDIFYKVFSKEMTLHEFEQWVYSINEPKSFIDSNEYLELISINYTEPSAFDAVCSIVSKQFQLFEYETARIASILNDIINKEAEAIGAIEETYYLYCKGYKFLKDIGLNYGLDIVVSECATQSFKDMYPKMIDLAKQVLALLENKQIVFSNETNDYGLFKYQDLRHET